VTLRSEQHLKKLQNNVLSNEDIELLFYDEAFFRRESTVTRGWYPRGHKSQVECPITFEKVGVCAAVNPRNGILFSLLFDGFDSDTFVYYLKWLIKKCGFKKKLVIVLDNASSHKSKKVKAFVEKNKHRIELLYLPPYSPDLNPIERVWKNLRYNMTHNVFFENLEALENTVINYLKKYISPNEHLTSLCCIN
jgi:putative transposase